MCYGMPAPSGSRVWLGRATPWKPRRCITPGGRSFSNCWASTPSRQRRRTAIAMSWHSSNATPSCATGAVVGGRRALRLDRQRDHRHHGGPGARENTRSLLLQLLTLAAALAHADRLGGCPLAGFGLLGLALSAARQIPSLLCSLPLARLPRPARRIQPASSNIRTTHLRGTSVLAGGHDAVALPRARRCHVPESVAALIHGKAEGNPLFTEELAYALRDGGSAAIRRGRMPPGRQVFPTSAS